jgi:hypothetical protein
MGCPHSFQIKGTFRTRVGFYTSRASAISAANANARGAAEVEAGLMMNGIRCPNVLCAKKDLSNLQFTITGTTSYFSLASIMYLEYRYGAVAEGTWTATVSCTGRERDAHTLAIFEAFYAAVKKRSGEVWTLADGDLGNMITGFSGGLFGDGCVAWALWILWWLNQQELYPITYEMWHIDGLIFRHQLVIIKLPTGEEFVLNPWKDKEHPIERREDYERRVGKLKPGFSQ